MATPNSELPPVEPGRRSDAGPKHPNAKTFKDSKGNIRPIKRTPVAPAPKKTAAKPVPRPNKKAKTQRIFADGARYSAANTAYNSAKGRLKGFIRNPGSGTGWSFVDELGRMADSRPPARRERVITPQQMQKLNPNFYKTQQAATAKPQSPQLPWLQGYAGGGGWSATTDGGFYNTESGQYWKPGTAIPGQQAAANPNGLNDLYASLMKMFEGI